MSDASVPDDVLTRVVAAIDWPDRAVAQEATARWASLTKPEGALGRLEDLGTWWASARGECPPKPPQRPTLVIVAGDHGVARTARTSAYPPEVTAQMVRTFLAERAAANALARQVGAHVRVVDVAVDAPADYADDLDPRVAEGRIRRASGSIDREDAMTLEEAGRAFQLGVAIADAEIDAGADLLIVGDMGIGNTTSAAAIIGLLAPADLLSVVGRGTGIDDDTWMRKAAAVRDAMRRGKPHKGSPLELLAAIGGPDIATMVGLLLGAAARRTPVILDGTVIAAAALIAHRAAYKSRDWWQAGHRSTEPAHSAALGRLDLTPLLDLKMRLGEGTGALLTIPLVASAAAALGEMLTFAEAGVSTAELRPGGPEDPPPTGSAE
jgi:nicotinate-nucleotide--dimethylbenzimidazole phosphoribosyltransferase